MTENEIISEVFKYSDTIKNESKNMYAYFLSEFVFGLKNKLQAEDKEAYKHISFLTIFKMFR